MEDIFASFAALWSTELVMLPALKLSKPVTKWPLQSVGIDMVHHAIYTTATGITFDIINKKK